LHIVNHVHHFLQLCVVDPHLLSDLIPEVFLLLLELFNCSGEVLNKGSPFIEVVLHCNLERVKLAEDIRPQIVCDGFVTALDN
jgi:hypothetical protein